LGPALKVKLWSSETGQATLDVTLPVRAFFSTDFSSVRHEGWVFSPRVNFTQGDLIPQTGLKLGVSAGPMFADSGYHQYFYEVEPAYATVSRPAYIAGGGYSGTTLTVGLSKTYRQCIFNAFVSADFLQGAVFEDSPLVKRETSVMSGFSVSWIFLKSERHVNRQE
jgi:outer membrane scaffolding protein for murein synthesis (MipA/OmpV family)